MKRVMPFIWLFIAAIIQASLFWRFGFLGVPLNLTLIILLLSVFEKVRYQRIVLGSFFSGLFLEGLSGLPFGSMVLIMVISALLFDRLLFLLPRDSFMHFLILIICGTLIYNLVLISVLSVMKLVGLSGFSPDISLVLAVGISMEMIFNLFGAVALYPLRKWIIL